jgi:hypothetical protein
MRSKLLFAALTATSMLAVPVTAFAQGFIYGGMGYEPYGPVGARHPTPSSTQGDVGPEGNNNGTLTPPAARYVGPFGAYARMRPRWHPAPSSTQGDVGPEGNNNGTYTRW